MCTDKQTDKQTDNCCIVHMDITPTHVHTHTPCTHSVNDVNVLQTWSFWCIASIIMVSSFFDLHHSLAYLYTTTRKALNYTCTKVCTHASMHEHTLALSPGSHMGQQNIWEPGDKASTHTCKHTHTQTAPLTPHLTVPVTAPICCTKSDSLFQFP